MTKKELRELYLAKRKNLAPPERAKLDDLLLIRFQQLQLPFIQTLFTFSPIGEFNEPAVHVLADYLEFRNPGLQVAYPVMNRQTGTIAAVLVKEDTVFRRNSFGIEEPVGGVEADPEAIDLVLVPLLAFDKEGYRVGYGKGYYDRFLAQCRDNCIKAGLSYFEPVTAISDRQEFDVPLSLCITPQQLYVF